MFGRLAGNFVPGPRPFRLALPDGWVERPADDGFNYVNEALREQLIVSVIEAKNPPLSDEQLRASIAELVRFRREAIAKLSEGHCRFDSEEVPETSGLAAASLRGVDTANSVCFALRFMGYPARIFTIAYYKYGCQEGSQPAEARLAALTAALEIDAA